MAWLTIPQAPVTAGLSGHLTDHNRIAADLSTLWGAAEQSVINVCAPPYNADPTGASDATTAIQNAINAANSAGGAVVYFPAGTYLVTPASSTSAALVLNNGSTGHQNVRLVGAGAKASRLQRSANGPILAMAGPATDTTGATHAKYCSMEFLRLDGNAKTGTMLQLYYADDLFFHETYMSNCPDVAVDTTEFWDSRFYNCVWEGCGSATSNALTPNVLLRNSAAASGFGASTDNVNQIKFVGCRWEAFHTGAVWVQQGVSNSNNPNGIDLVTCKMETSSVNGGPHLLVDANSKAVNVDGLYIYSGGFNGAYSTAQDGITWSAQDSVLSNVFIATGATQTIANGVTLNSTVATESTSARNVTGIYNGLPTGQHVAIGTTTGNLVIDNCNSNQTAPTTLNAHLTYVENSSSNSILAGEVGGDTFKRFQLNANGAMLYGPGNGAADIQTGRTATGVWSMTTGIMDPQHGTKTTAAAAVLTPTFANNTASQLSDVTRDYMVYFTVGTAGSAFSIAIGPTSTPANTILTSNTPNAGEAIAFRLPAGWYVKWAGTLTTLANQIAIGC